MDRQVISLPASLPYGGRSTTIYCPWRHSCASVLILNSRGRSRSRGGRSRSCGRSRGGCRDGLLNSRLDGLLNCGLDRDGLLNCHGTRLPSRGSFLLITTTNAPDQQSNKHPHSEHPQEECPREPQVPPPPPPPGIPSPPHETLPSLIVVVAGSGLIIHELHSFLASHLSLSRRTAPRTSENSCSAQFVNKGIMCVKT